MFPFVTFLSKTLCQSDKFLCIWLLKFLQLPLYSVENLPGRMGWSLYVSTYRINKLCKSVICNQNQPSVPYANRNKQKKSCFCAATLWITAMKNENHHKEVIKIILTCTYIYIYIYICIYIRNFHGFLVWRV